MEKPSHSDHSLSWVAQRYEIKEQIGYGGLAQVYSAWDHRLKKIVALKQIPNEESEKDKLQMIEQTMQEAMTTASFRHPHIVTVLNYGSDRSGAFIAMELVEGENLEQLLTRRSLQMEEFYLFAKQALDGIAAAHARGVMHRDLKPSNFMLQKVESKPFNVKLLDFGLARQLSEPKPQTVDHLNALMGTIYYMAPEQLQQKPVDQRADIYSFGCILYEALAGETAFRGETVADLIHAHIHDYPKNLTEIRPSISPKLNQWIMKFLRKNPQERYASAKEALQQLPKLRDCSKREGTLIQALLRKFLGAKKPA